MVVVNVTDVPDFAVLGPVTVTATASGETVTVADVLADFELASVIVRPTVEVPFVAKWVVKVGHPHVAFAMPLMVQT